jgi:hypothetical protein
MQLSLKLTSFAWFIVMVSAGGAVIPAGKGILYILAVHILVLNCLDVTRARQQWFLHCACA